MESTDRSEESRGESFLFNTQAFHEKWLQDIADSQKESGSVPDVAPTFWLFYTDNVTWPSSTVMIPDALYDQFGNRAIWLYENLVGTSRLKASPLISAAPAPFSSRSDVGP